MSTYVTLRDCGLTRAQAANAVLSENYQAMIVAMRKVENADECKEWISRADAIAGYYRMAKDREPMYVAARIRLRAVRRLGELLNLEYARGHQPGQVFKNISILRQEMAGDESFGLIAQKMAQIDPAVFEAIVERPQPPLTEWEIVRKNTTIEDGIPVHAHEKPKSPAWLRYKRVDKALKAARDLKTSYNGYNIMNLPLTPVEISQLRAMVADLDQWVENLIANGEDDSDSIKRGAV
jgi:hypothetical protein